jgi:anti-sigma regulatory factor (Ser/Thr protein kinase)
VQNLIANAVKYGGRDHWVGIRAEHAHDRKRSEVRITISDHGAGIPAEELPHIFDPFYRGADAVDRQIHGNGLGLSLVKRIVEKPKPADAPSNLAVVGRYLLTPAVYDKLATIGRGAGGEIQLTDGIAALMNDESVYAYAFEGRRFDCGSKLGYLEATVEFGLKHENLGDQFANYLARLVATRLRG